MTQGPMTRAATMPALKEWSAAVHALLDGRQWVLLRKGGIGEKRFGEYFYLALARFDALQRFTEIRGDLFRPLGVQSLCAFLAGFLNLGEALRGPVSGLLCGDLDENFFGVVAQAGANFGCE